jgi:predicted PurR-regulated permease PerM
MVQILEGSVLSPRIVGDRVGLHPAWVMFAILIFAHFWGFIGLLVAVPLAATIKIFASVWISAYRKRIFRPMKKEEE